MAQMTCSNPLKSRQQTSTCVYYPGIWTMRRNPLVTSAQHDTAKMGVDSMPTWLDEWCRGMHLRRIQQLTEIGRPRDDFCRSDGLAAREAAFDALAARLSFQERH